MFKIKFKNILFFSNKKNISSPRVILFFYGLGCSGNDFKFLFKQINFKSQLFIAELPGHNNLSYNNDNLYKYSRKIFLFIKKNKIKEITFFAHSLGGIIPIILVKNFLKKKILIKKFINYEGNLTEDDTETLTKKTISYKKNDFTSTKFDKLISKCSESNKRFINLWSNSLKKTSSVAFYDLSKECVKLSKTNELLHFFKIFFKKSIYVSGDKSQINKSGSLFGSIRFKIKNSGHFSFFENKTEFSRMFNKLILRKI